MVAYASVLYTAAYRVCITNKDNHSRKIPMNGYNGRLSKMRVLLSACREFAVYSNAFLKVLYVLYMERNVLIHAPYIRIVVFWCISNMPPVIT